MGDDGSYDHAARLFFQPVSFYHRKLSSWKTGHSLLQRPTPPVTFCKSANTLRYPSRNLEQPSFRSIILPYIPAVFPGVCRPPRINLNSCQVSPKRGWIYPSGMAKSAKSYLRSSFLRNFGVHPHEFHPPALRTSPWFSMKYTTLAFACLAAAAPAWGPSKTLPLTPAINSIFPAGEPLTPQILATFLQPNEANLARNSYVVRDGTRLRLLGDHVRTIHY